MAVLPAMNEFYLIDDIIVMLDIMIMSTIFTYLFLHKLNLTTADIIMLMNNNKFE